jgi:tetratricopeptide (TPR) repeat protein
MGRTVFISYTKKDEDWAMMIGSELEQMGHSVVSMYKGFQGNFIFRIKEAYDKCDDIILIYSPEYEQSGYCKHEMTVALKMVMEGYKVKVHPIKVDPYRLHNFYSILSYIDLSVYAPGSPEVRSYFREEISKKFGEPSSGKRPNTIHNLPLRIPNFTGRKHIIENLHRLFTSETCEHSIQALIGLGGVGKTMISLEYAYTYFTQYTVIGFFHAEEKTALQQEFSELAKRLQLPEAQLDNIDYHIAALRRYLEEHDQWLLIFDNATAPADLYGFLPAFIRGHIIITSRNSLWGSMACINPIDSFSEKESIQYLEKRLHRTNELPCFRTVAHELDRIPIALDIAAAYMDANQISCEDYRAVLEETHPPFPHLMKVWGPSFAKISKTSICLLEYLTYFSPDDIPEEVLVPALRRTPDLSEHVKDKEGYYDALSSLLMYSFVSKDRDTRALTMHRIVQNAVRDSMDIETKKKKAASAVESISELFPFKSDDPETIDREMWIQCSKMLPHAVYAADIAYSLGASPAATLHLYAQVASFLRELDNLPEAEAFAEKSVTLASADKETLHYAIALETRARILRDQGRNTEAQALMLEAISIEEKLHQRVDESGKDYLSDKEKRHLAICYDGYGRILSNLGKAQEALSFYNKAIPFDEKSYGGKHPKIAIRKNNIGCAYGQMGKDNLEIRCLKEALKIEEEYYKGNHPHIAIRLGNLALVYERANQQSRAECLDRALAYWERAFAIDHEFYGLGHHLTLSRMYGLAGHYCIRTEFEKALQWNNDALAITTSEGAGGYHHAMSLLHRGNTYVEMMDYPSASRDYDEALAIITKLSGTEPQEVGGKGQKLSGRESRDRSIILKNIAYMKGKQQDYASAVDYLQRALEMDEVSNLAQNRGYMINLLNLGFYYSQSGDFAKTKSCLEQALNVTTRIGEKNSPDHSLVLKHLASIEGQENQYLNAAEHLQAALEIDALNDQAKSREYCISLSNLGYYYTKSGDFAKAKSCLEQALPFLEMEFSRNSQEYLITLVMLINTKIATDDIKEISELITRYETIKERTKDRNHADGDGLLDEK